MKKLLFIFNPRSGKGQIKSALPDILDIMVKSGFDITVHTTQCQGDCTEVVAARAKEFDRIVVSGGDGTLDEAVTGMMRLPIGREFRWVTFRRALPTTMVIPWESTRICCMRQRLP